MSPSTSFQTLLTNARKLLPFLPPKPISPRSAKEQDASVLYSHLTTELRCLVWETYFRGHAVHIHRSRKRLRATECSRWDADDAFAPSPHFSVCRCANVFCDHLSLLLTCKRIYFECINTLYRETSFDFSHAPRCLAIMLDRRPATHIAQIAQINLKWELYWPLFLKEKNPGKDEILWVDIWNVLAAMEGLKWLRVELELAQPHQAPEWTEIEWTLWEGIKKVTRPSHFELILPFPAATSTREEALPCTVIRRVLSYDP